MSYSHCVSLFEVGVQITIFFIFLNRSVAIFCSLTLRKEMEVIAKADGFFIFRDRSCGYWLEFLVGTWPRKWRMFYRIDFDLVGHKRKQSLR